MEIGKEQPAIYIEPLTRPNTAPVPTREQPQTPAPVETPQREKEKVAA